MSVKKIIKRIGLVLGIFGMLILAGAWKTYGPFVRAANSVKQLDQHFYYMEFKGNTYLEEYLTHGGAASNQELAVYIENLLRGNNMKKLFKNEVPLNTGCATISAKTADGKKVFGRNYDWSKDQFKCGLIIKNTPKHGHGYKSISTCQLDFLGFGDNYKPDSFGNKYLATSGLFVTLDGMNEKGLCVSDLLAGDQEVTNQNTEKSDLTTTLALRGILDFWADVPEAIKFLENYDMHSVIGYAHHFAISDAAGRSVVVEYLDNKMIVTEAAAVTNHYLAEGKVLDDVENSTIRLQALNNLLEEKEYFSEADIRDALNSIHASSYGGKSKTWWSAVFNQHDLRVRYYLAENYDEEDSLTFKL